MQHLQNEPIIFLDRKTREKKIEKVYGDRILRYLYSHKFGSSFLLTFIARLPLFSFLFGFWQKMPWTKSKIAPFVRDYEIKEEEFEKPIEAFTSFNDFFIRKLNAQARPIAEGKEIAILPADGRYRFFPSIKEGQVLNVKGEELSLESLLGSSLLAHRYRQGSLVICRLAPPDYHRFHFPCDTVAGEPHLLAGPLFSVNPIALSRNPGYLFRNRRMVTELMTHCFGKVIMIEVGATNVGTLIQTFKPDHPYQKGKEKGYFSFGGSALLLLFEEGKIRFDADLFSDLEIYGQMGQSMGISLRASFSS